MSRGSALEIKPSDGIHFPAYLFDGPVDDLPGIPVSEALLGEQEDQTKEPKKLTRIRFSGFPDYNDPSGMIIPFPKMLVTCQLYKTSSKFS